MVLTGIDGLGFARHQSPVDATDLAGFEIRHDGLKWAAFFAGQIFCAHHGFAISLQGDNDLVCFLLIEIGMEGDNITLFKANRFEPSPQFTYL